MVEPDKQIRISTELARKLFPLAVSICVVISLIIPGAYCYLEFNRMQKEADLYSRQLAEDVRKLASTAPTLWKYQATKYIEIIENFVPNKNSDKKFNLSEPDTFKRLRSKPGPAPAFSSF